MPLETYLVHHGVKNQSWGERRYQYKSGIRTVEGQYHRAELEGYTYGGHKGKTEPAVTKTRSKPTTAVKKVKKPEEKEKTERKTIDKDTVKTIFKAGSMVAVAGLAAYGAYKTGQINSDNKLVKQGQDALLKVLEGTSKKYFSKSASVIGAKVGSMLADELVSYVGEDSAVQPMVSMIKPAMSNAVAKAASRAAGNAFNTVSNKNHEIQSVRDADRAANPEKYRQAEAARKEAKEAKKAAKKALNQLNKMNKDEFWNRDGPDSAVQRVLNSVMDMNTQVLENRFNLNI